CGAEMPLVRSFLLSTKKGNETWVEPLVKNGVPKITFQIRSGSGKPPEGTVGRKGAKCMWCSAPVLLEYVRSEGRSGRLSAQLMRSRVGHRKLNCRGRH